MSRASLRDVLDLVSSRGTQAVRGRLRVRSGPAGSVLSVRKRSNWVAAASWGHRERPNPWGLLWCAERVLRDPGWQARPPMDGTLSPEEHEVTEVMES